MTYPQSELTHGGGLTYQGVAGEALPAYRVVYTAGDGRWYMADADVWTSTPILGFTTEPISVGQKGLIITEGIVHASAFAYTAGQPLYLSQTQGLLTHTKPTGTGIRVVRLGGAITSDTIYFDVSGAGDLQSMLDYEVQTGEMAEPVTTSRGNGHAVEVYNSNLDRTVLWLRCNSDGDWMGVEVL